MKKIVIELPDNTEVLTIVSIGRINVGQLESLNVSNSVFDLAQGMKIRYDGEKWTQEKNTEECDITLNIAKTALEKQIAKKPFCKKDPYTNLILHYYCPTCGKYFGQAGKHNTILFDKESFCQGTDCGQKIDWESAEKDREGK